MKNIVFILIILFSFTTTILQAQGTFIVKGTVKDASYGAPLMGVSIHVKNTMTGTITNVDGEYSITLSKGSHVLVFSYVGYRSQEFNVNEKITLLNIELQEDSQQLEEVVVMGYARASKRSYTAAVSSVSSSNVQKNNKKNGSTWKRSGMPDNSIRLEVGDNDILDLQAMQMAVQVDGFRVRVLLDCFFFNDKKDGLEGTFKLRLPNGASPYYFAFGETEYMDEDDYDEDKYEELIKNSDKVLKPYGKKIPYVDYTETDFDLSPEEIDNYDSRSWENVKEARIVSKQKAARAYEQTVNQRVDPALMEWGGADFFTCRVFPLTRGKLHRVVVGYDLNMTEALNFREYTLVIPQGAKELKLDASLYTSKNMVPVISPTTNTSFEEGRMAFSLFNPKKKEYTIRYNTIDPVILHDEDNDYFATNFRIELPEVKQEKLPSDAVFLFDVSLSSQPDKFNVWLKLMEEILSKNQDIIKRFAVLCFNIETFWWNKYYIKNNYYNLNSFLEYANTLALEGATDLGTALKEASNPSWSKENMPKHIFLMSDADFNWGESNMHALRALVNAGDRVHTYKTGLSGTNSTVLDYLSKETNGFSFTVTGEEEAELTAKSFRYRPWEIEDIQVEGVDDFLISGAPSQLYNGQKLIFAGREVPLGEIYIRLNNGLETKELRLKAKESITSNLTKRLYGQLALTKLENYSYYTEEAAESYATYFKIPNAAMSFLMLESSWEYDRFGINDYSAESFVENNTVQSIIEELLEENEIIPLANGKIDFIRWLERLRDDSEIDFEPADKFWNYIKRLPEEVFDINMNPYNYIVHYAIQQTEDELMLINDDDLRYDNLLSVASKRRKEFSAADALKLLSSVIEKNPGDFIALRDLAMKAIEWNLGEQAYYMMRRIIANREYEAVAYLTAADALAKSGNIDMAIIYYTLCVFSDWDEDYGSFSEIAALQCLRFLNQLEKESNEKERKKKKESRVDLSSHTKEYISYLKPAIESYLSSEGLLIDEADIVIIINWNTNNTDIDLHVLEPDGEECYYGNIETPIGGMLTMDVTEGYGPEMYVLKNTVSGKYRVFIDYYSDDATKTSSKTKVYLDFYRNWGRTNEKYIQKVIILEDMKDRQDVLQFEVQKIIK